MKWLSVAVCLVLSGSAFAQIPELHVRLDATISYEVQQNAPSKLYLYDVMGRPSTLSISFYTEQSFKVYVAERLQRIPGDQNTDLFDEYFLEDEGIWRVGKQYLPFGGGRILHESAIAARGDTNLILEGLPISIALCDSGGGFQSGAIGRIGSLIGVSAAVGRHFGISGTSLDDVRHPSDAPGQGRGWKYVVGADASRRFGHFTWRLEGAAFRGGETPFDGDLTVTDVSVTADPRRGESWTLSWSHATPQRQDFYRLGGSFAIMKNLSFEPMIRFRDSSLFDISAQMRIRF